MFTFKKATKEQAKARVALIGVSGSGKSYTAMQAAKAHANGGKVAAIDTERGSLSKYSDLFEFDVLELENFSPRNYVQAIKAAEEAGYSVLVIDSLSHAWSGIGGALDMVDKANARSDGRAGNSFAAWRSVTPEHNALVDAILQANMHVIVTMRVKTEYVIEEDSRGKKVPRKVGLAPIQRDGLEYEFDLIADMNIDNQMAVSKSRCPAMTGVVTLKPDTDTFRPFAQWLSTGASPAPKPAPVVDNAGPKPLREQVIEAATAWLGADGPKAASQLLTAYGWVPPAKPTDEQFSAVLDLIQNAHRNGLTLTAVLPKPATVEGGAA